MRVGTFHTALWPGVGVSLINVARGWALQKKFIYLWDARGVEVCTVKVERRITLQSRIACGVGIKTGWAENGKSSTLESKICIREVQNVVINFRKINKRGTLIQDSRVGN